MLVNSTILNTIKKQKQILEKEQKLIGLEDKEFNATKKLLDETYILTNSFDSKCYGQYIQDKETSSEITKNVFEAMQKIKNINNVIQNNVLQNEDLKNYPNF